MSLLSLKRKSPTPKKGQTSLQQFVDSAKDQLYGQNVVAVEFARKQNLQTIPGLPHANASKRMTRHCFTLDQQAKDALEQLAKHENKSRSAMVRTAIASLLAASQQ